MSLPYQLPTRTSNDINAAADVNALMSNDEYLDDRIDDVINVVYPVGCFYTQYPIAADNNKTTAFPSSKEPAALFGGTWVQVWNTDAVVFRTEGSPVESETAGRTNGLQTDQFQGHGHYIKLYSNSGESIQRPSRYNSKSYTYENPYDITAPRDIGYGLRYGYETRARNRLVKIWRRTA